MVKRVRIEGLEEWESFVAEIPQELMADVERVTKNSGLKIESEAKWNAPVDTGRLEASIGNETDSTPTSILVEIGTDVEYAAAVEYSQPYLFPAYNKEVAKFKKQIDMLMKGMVD